jgi:aconitate hydratase
MEKQIVMNSFNTLSTIEVGGKKFSYHSLEKLEKTTGVNLARFPYSHKILLENLLRHEDGEIVNKSQIEAVLRQDPKKESDEEIQFTPARVLLQDFTGVPVLADLAAMRNGMISRGGDPARVNPLRPVELVIDHSVQIDEFGTPTALQKNVEMEFARNHERYEFLKWGQKAFHNFSVVPPATGICHQVNLEFLSHVAMVDNHDNNPFIYPDTLVGTDSHTTMINGLGVLGWGVGGIEAEAAMLGQPCTMLIPQVVGFELIGKLSPGTTATDLVLTITQILRRKGVVGKFVEYFGEGVKNLAIADRATISNMAPEYGATAGIFPVDEKVVEFLRNTGRDERAERAEVYFKQQNLWGAEGKEVQYSEVLSLDLSDVEACMAGPARPQDRVNLSQVRHSFRTFLVGRYQTSLNSYSKEQISSWTDMSDSMKGLAYEQATFHPDKDLGPLGSSQEITTPEGIKFKLTHGSIVIAAITSCTNTSNPALMMGAALLARNAIKKGMNVKPWVKTSFAPGSLAVRDYLAAAGLQTYLDQLKFNIAGFGCTTCIGNSGPLPDQIQKAIEKSGFATVGVLSGNRNFEARIHPFVMANYLASPLLVVAAALTGNINVNMAQDPLALNDKGQEIYLKDIWPDPKEVDEFVQRYVTAEKFKKVYSDVFTGDQHWQKIQVPGGSTFAWSDDSTYIKQPPFLSPEFSKQDPRLHGARILSVFGDNITTDHISPAGNFGLKTPAGQYLFSLGVGVPDFNSYGSRRGNHEVMMRGTFANVRVRNLLVQKEGGFTKIAGEDKEVTIFEAAEIYKQRGIPLVIFAGKEYGTGSSRDWAAKGTRLLGVRAVIAESFERIHRSNLVGMGVLPLQLPVGITVHSLGLSGDEEVDLPPLDTLTPKSPLEITIRNKEGVKKYITQVRIDTPNELKYYRAGGILPYVLNRLHRKA